MVIINITTTIKQEYRLPTPIDVNLISKFTKSILDTIQIDFTVKALPKDKVIQKGDKIQAYYAGAFAKNGTLFDHSFQDPENLDPSLKVSLIDTDGDGQDDPVTGGLDSKNYNPVIIGFKKGLIDMVPQETHVIIVPPELGYPIDQPLGGETLIFEVFLISNDRDL